MNCKGYVCGWLSLACLKTKFDIFSQAVPCYTIILYGKLFIDYTFLKQIEIFNDGILFIFDYNKLQGTRFVADYDPFADTLNLEIKGFPEPSNTLSNLRIFSEAVQ